MNYTVSANTGAARSGDITVTAGSNTAKMNVNQDSAALTAAFTVKSTTGKADNVCEVVSGFKVKCTFDASGSSPASQITSYLFTIVETKETLGNKVQVTDPGPISCNVFNGSTGGQINANVSLTVTAGSSSVTTPQRVTFIKNGVC